MKTRNDFNIQLTANFNLLEFLENRWATPHDQQRIFNDTTDEIIENIQELANNLQVLRDDVKRPIKVNIAFRPLWWELERKRSGQSMHVQGMACDFNVIGIAPHLVSANIDRLIILGKMKKGGLKAYKNFVHYDIRGTNARW
jgi:uncharacterized protein YcbK (DUF882 family)